MTFVAEYYHLSGKKISLVQFEAENIDEATEIAQEQAGRDKALVNVEEIYDFD